MTIHHTRTYKKLDRYTQHTLGIAIDKLCERYESYKEQNIPITKLFNDDIIIHDIIDDDLYVYKCRARGIQIRLLYEVDNENRINVLDFYIKNNKNSVSGKASTKYIKKFESNDYRRVNL